MHVFVLRPNCWLLNTLGYYIVCVRKGRCKVVTQREENEKLGPYKWGSDQGWHFILAGKCSDVGVAAENTGALIGADGKDSHLITISQLFTFLHLWQVGKLENVICAAEDEKICFHVSSRAFLCLNLCIIFYSSLGVLCWFTRLKLTVISCNSHPFYGCTKTMWE